MAINWGPGSPKPVGGTPNEGKSPRWVKRARKRYKAKYGRRHPGFGPGKSKTPTPSQLHKQNERDRNRRRKRRQREQGGGGKGGKGGGGGRLGDFLDPNNPLSGRSLRQSARALTDLELTPGINAFSREMAGIEAQRMGSEAGLHRLGSITGDRVKGAYGALGASSGQTVARMQALAESVNANERAVNKQSAENTAGYQKGQLGALTEGLEAANAAPSGGSASQAALASATQQQQQAQESQSKAQAAFAQAQGAAFTGLAAGQAQAAQQQGAEAQADLAEIIANRIAESNMEHRSAYMDAQGSRADLQATRGATMLKNLLELRGGEREWINARNPVKPTSRNVNIYKGLNKKGTAAAQIKVAQIYAAAKAQGANAQKIVAQIQQQTGMNHDAALKAYGKLAGGGGGKNKRKRPSPKGYAR
jgi:hypothetical protein